MKKLACLLMFLLGISFGFAQTKLIAHKRHSGADFQYALANNTADIKDSNLGVAPRTRVENAQLDSVIFIDNQKAIMVTSEFCRENYRKKTKDSISVWKPGRDTVYNHPLFSHKNKLDSIKTVLKTQYNFKNDIDSVVFVGYNNKQKATKKKKKQFVPIVITPKNNNDKTNGFTSFNLYLFAVSFAFLLSVFVYWVCLKRFKHVANA